MLDGELPQKIIPC